MLRWDMLFWDETLVEGGGEELPGPDGTPGNPYDIGDLDDLIENDPNFDGGYFWDGDELVYINGFGAEVARYTDVGKKANGIIFATDEDDELVIWLPPTATKPGEFAKAVEGGDVITGSVPAAGVDFSGTHVPLNYLPGWYDDGAENLYLVGQGGQIMGSAFKTDGDIARFNGNVNEQWMGGYWEAKAGTDTDPFLIFAFADVKPTNTPGVYKDDGGNKSYVINLTNLNGALEELDIDPGAAAVQGEPYYNSTTVPPRLEIEYSDDLTAASTDFVKVEWGALQGGGYGWKIVGSITVTDAGGNARTFGNGTALSVMDTAGYFN